LGVSIPSEAEYQETRTSDFSLFPPDDYILQVLSVTEQPGKVDIFDKPKPGEAQRTYTGLEVRFTIVSFANGDELVDEDGAEVHEARTPLFFDWFDPERVGLKPQPAKARKFFAYAMGKELEDRIDIEEWSELVGKRLIGGVIVKPNAKGERRNKVVDYRPIRARRRAAAAVANPAEAAAAKVAPAAIDVAAAAKEIFAESDDLPF
jgi:hypothetical protein